MYSRNRLKCRIILNIFSVSTMILFVLGTMLLLVINQMIEIQSPLIKLLEIINSYSWRGVWAFITYLSAILVILVLIKYRIRFQNLVSKVFSFTYITIVDRITCALILSLITYRIFTYYWLEDLSFINDYYLLAGLLSFFIFIRIYKVFTIKSKTPLINPFVDDTPATDDLLNRTSIVDSLVNAITGVSVRGSFVMSMYGEWGEGKTTVINMVEKELKNDKEDVHVILFEPWHYNSMDSIIKNYFNLICESLGRKLLTLDLVMLISDYRDLLLDSIKGFKLNKVVEMIIPNFSSRKSVKSIKHRIEQKLKRLDQKVVIFIDDLDRMERDEILLILKMIRLFSDFDNFIYILSFDKKRVERILYREMRKDKEYLDKFIQVGFMLPKVPQETLSEILLNYLNQFIRQTNIKLDEETTSKIQKSFKDVSYLFNDIRKIKRFYNLLGMKFAMTKSEINFYDFFIITFVEFFFSNQYKEISKNKNKFVYFLSDVGFTLRPQSINEERKAYYLDFFTRVRGEEEREILKKTLGTVFQSIKNYSMGYDNLMSTYQKPENALRKPIEDSFYFDLYFTFEKNDYIILNDQIQEFIMILNHGTNLYEKNNAYTVLFTELNLAQQIQYFKNMRGFIKNIEPSVLMEYIKIIYKNASIYNDKDKEFMGLTVYSHAQGLIGDLIDLAPTRVKKDILREVVINCRDIEFVRGVLYFTEHHSEHNQQFREIVNESKTLFGKILYKKYIEYGANIFISNQKRHGMWALIEYIDNSKEVEEYYYNLIEKDVNNIKKFLSIFKTITTSYHSGEETTEVKFNAKFFNEYFDKEKVFSYVTKYQKFNTINHNEEGSIIELFVEFYKGNKNVYLEI
ncbi:KAP family P-loop NTPase fold protein [Rossellomorea aquimaris]|uniref:KAP family P-loop NTPase fold protein n=1 Tax=Rossellomorea aquimaris TaxID=189382 RepID=UPI00249579DB|nr:P-loop NTPase fold protein [Rossellomorea aquimaris]